ncbi:TPA: hypothetical protein HA351_08850 [Methanosarcinaceae archaeon]|nr:hypothetical protein [Methanosarcinaceae archaeon]
MMLFLGMVLVPAAGAAPDKNPGNEASGEKHADASSWEEWKQAHTVEVEVATVYKYKKDGQFEITETYSGEKLKQKFKVDKLTKTKSFTVPSGKQVAVNTQAGPFVMQPGDRKEVLSEKSAVLTAADDPYEWWQASASVSGSVSYPQWTWSKVLWFYELEDPINLVWEQSNLKTVKSVILRQRWVDNPSEYTHYLSYPDGSWVKGDGMADSKYRVLGGYHARLWELPNGAVVANAHQDDDIFIIPGHQVKGYENAEYEVSGFFGTVHGSYWLDNECYNGYYNAYNNGWATLV